MRKNFVALISLILLVIVVSLSGCNDFRQLSVLNVDEDIKLVLSEKNNQYYLISLYRSNQVSQEKIVLKPKSMMKSVKVKDVKFLATQTKEDIYLVTMSYYFYWGSNEKLHDINIFGEINQKGKIVKIYDELYDPENLF